MHPRYPITAAIAAYLNGDQGLVNMLDGVVCVREGPWEAEPAKLAATYGPGLLIYVNTGRLLRQRRGDYRARAEIGVNTLHSRLADQGGSADAAALRAHEAADSAFRILLGFNADAEAGQEIPFDRYKAAAARRSLHDAVLAPRRGAR